jgi:hypothetical protein
LQNTDTCKSKAPACNGGAYGPPSPRLAEVPATYNTQRMNRHNGPEDQSLGDRCMLGREPDFNAFRRIVQGPESVAIGIDTGQGQGYQRVVYLTGKHPPASIRLRHGDSRGRYEGNYGLAALLIGARLDDKKFKEGRGPNPASQDTATDFGPGAGGPQ